MPEPNDTRTRILTRLCVANQTVAALAADLAITPTAVRKTLARLQEDGLVRYQIVRRGVGKPAHEFAITSAGEDSLSRAYLPVLQQLLHVLEQQMPGPQFQQVLRATGRELAQVFGGDRRQRLNEVAELLRSLGGVIDVKRTGSGHRIDCSCCVIGAVVKEHPAACKTMESMLSSALGVSVQERCDRNGRPKCHFEISRQ